MSLPPAERDIQRRLPVSPVDVTVPGREPRTDATSSPSQFDHVSGSPSPVVAADLVQRPSREVRETMTRGPREVMVTEIVVRRDKKPEEIQPTELPEGDSTAALIQASKPASGQVDRTVRAVKLDGDTLISGSEDAIASVARTREMTQDDHDAIDTTLPFWSVVVGERDVTVTDTGSGRPSPANAARTWDGEVACFVDSHPSSDIGVEAHVVPVDTSTLGTAIWKLGRDAEHGEAFPDVVPDPDSGVLPKEFAKPFRDQVLQAQSAGQRPQVTYFLVGGRTPEESIQHAHDFAGSVAPSPQYPLSLRVLPEEAVSRSEVLERPLPDDPRNWHFSREVGTMMRVPTIRELTGTPRVVKPEFSPNPPEVDSRGLTIVIGHEATNGKPIPLNVRNHFTVNGATEAGKTTLMLTILRETALARRRRKDAVTSKIVVGLEKEVPALPIAEVYKAAGIDEPVIKYALGETGTDHFPAALALFQTMEGLPLTDYAHGIITMYRMFFTASEQGKGSSDGRGLTMLTQSLQESIYGLLEKAGYNVALNTTVFKAGQPAPFTLRQLSDAMAETMARLESTQGNDGGRWVNDVKAFYRTNIEGPAAGPAGEQLVGTGQVFDWKEAMRQGSTIAVDVSQVHQDYRALYTAVVFMKAHQALQVLNRKRQPGELPYDGLGLVDEARGLVPDNATGSAFLTWLAISRSFDLDKQQSDEPDAGFGIGLFSQSPILPGEGDQNIATRIVLQTPPGVVQQTIGKDLGLSPEYTDYLGHMQSGEGILWSKRKRSGGINNIIVSKAPRATGAQVEGPEKFIKLRPAFKERETAEVIDAAERYLATPWGKIFVGYVLFVNALIDNGHGFIRSNGNSRPIEKRPGTSRPTSGEDNKGEVNQIDRSIDAYLAQHVFNAELHDRVRAYIYQSAADKVDLETRKAVLTAQLPADELTATLPDVATVLLTGGPLKDGGLDLKKINPYGLFSPFRMRLEQGLQPLPIDVEGSSPVDQRRKLELKVRKEVERRHRDFKDALETSLRKKRNAPRIDEIKSDILATPAHVPGGNARGQLAVVPVSYAHVPGGNAREQLEIGLPYLTEQAILNPAILEGKEWVQVAAQLKELNEWIDAAPPFADIAPWVVAYRQHLPDMEIDFSGMSLGEQLRKVDKLEEVYRSRTEYVNVPLIDFFTQGSVGLHIFEETIASIMALQQPEGTIYATPTVEQVSLQRLIESSSEAEWGQAADDFLQLMQMHPYAGSKVVEMINTLVYNLIRQHTVAKERSQGR